jgi:hypothetical protein
MKRRNLKSFTNQNRTYLTIRKIVTLNCKSVENYCRLEVYCVIKDAKLAL